MIAASQETAVDVGANTDSYTSISNSKPMNDINVSPLRCCAKGSSTFIAKTFQSVSPTKYNDHTPENYRASNIKTSTTNFVRNVCVGLQAEYITFCSSNLLAAEEKNESNK